MVTDVDHPHQIKITSALHNKVRAFLKSNSNYLDTFHDVTMQLLKVRMLLKVIYNQKQDWRAVDSSKKRMNEFVLFAEKRYLKISNVQNHISFKGKKEESHIKGLP